MKRPLAVALAMLLVISACSADDSGDASTTDATSVVASSAATTPEIAATTSKTTAPAPLTSETTATEVPKPGVTSGATANTTDEDFFAESIVDAANAEGSVVFYTSTTGDGPKRLEEAFESAYPGIDVEVVTGAPAEMLARLASEHEAGELGADVVAQHDGTLARTFQSQGVWAPIESPVVDDERWVPHVEDDYVTVRYTTFGLAYSPEGVDQAPEEWSDLISDQFNGRLGLHDYTSVDVTAIWLHLLGEELGEEFLKDLAARNPRFFPGTSAMRELVVAGDLLAFAVASGSELAAKAGGAPIDVAFPKPTVGSPTYAAVNVDAKHPKAAQLFMDFLVSEAGQTAFVNYDSSPVYDERGVTVVDLTDYTREELDQMKAELNSIFGR